jgi:hypothetical protein
LVITSSSALASAETTSADTTPTNGSPVAPAKSLQLEADLSISLDIPQGITLGTPYTAQLGILNIGNASSSAATVNVLLPAGVQLDPAGLSLLAGSGCEAFDAQTIVCYVDAISGGQSRRIQLPLLNTAALRKGADSLTVKVQGVSFERNLENNVARIAVLGFSASPVSLALTGSNAPSMTLFAVLLLALGYALSLLAKPRKPLSVRQ